MEPQGYRPAGTVTLVFTDIEGSTRLARELGDRYGETLAEHRRVLREIWDRHGGTEIDTQGDAFFVAFGRASDAVAAAADVQRALASHPWPEGERVRVRIGIHTGEPSVTSAGYVGAEVHRAARIAAAAHGGQVLVSASTRAVLGNLPEGVTLRSLGRYLLKDFPEPEPLFQLVAPGLELDFPPPRAKPVRTTNLPTPPTSLIGRERELADLRAPIESREVRLLTITGPGGIGKTRLAQQLGLQSLSSFGGGVYFVDLSALIDADLVLPTIAHAIPLGERPAEPLAEWLREHLDERDMLIILDNLEQLIEAAPAIADLVGGTREPVFLATSREPLRVAGEHLYPLSPLDVPDVGPAGPERSVDVEGAGRSAGVRLFVQRAREAQPDFALDATNAAEVAEICVRLDGIPLAIELAAPWLRVLDPAGLLGQFDSRLDLLAGGRRDAPERQQTMRGAIDWSYRLLDPEEQEMFARLGVFAGGWSLDAADAVCRTGTDGPPTLITLGSLVEKSLVRQDAASGEVRFGMLDSIRAFALERLEHSKQDEETGERHAEFYLALAERAEPELYGPGQRDWTDRLSRDLDNIRAALVWAGARPERAALGLRLTGALALFWFWTGLYREGLERTTTLASAAGAVPDAVGAKALWSAGFMASLLGEEGSAREFLAESLALARRLGDRSLVARSLDMLGLHAFFGDDPMGARRLLEESISEARSVGDRWCLADALGTLGSILPLQGELEMAEAMSREALRVAGEAHDDQGRRMALFGIALTVSRRGDHEETLAAAEEGLRISRAIGDAWFVSYFLWLLAMTAAERGETEPAKQRAEEALLVARQLQGPLLIVCALEAVAAAAISVGDAAGARSALVEARDVGEHGGVPGSYVSSVVRLLGELDSEAGRPDEATALFAQATELAQRVGDTWGLARTLTARGRAAAREGRRFDARRMFAESLSTARALTAWAAMAEAMDGYAATCLPEEASLAANLLGGADQLRGRLGAPRPPWLSPEDRRTREKARSTLGEEAFALELKRDWATTVEEVIRLGSPHRD